MKPKDGYTAKQKVIIGVWAGILVWILAMTIRSTDWRFADRSSVGLAPLPEDEKGAVVQVYVARTYSWRGAFAVHSWVAVKPENAKTYTIYQVMGWYLRRGLPAVSVTQGIPDRRWYGSEPRLVGEVRGADAARAIPAIERAVQNYPYGRVYRAWPGPNSNTFVSHIIRSVPELKFDLPSIAIGKDWLVGNRFVGVSESKSGVQFSLYGLFGVTLGWYEGVELNVLGLTFGIDIRRPAVKLPLFGRLGLSKN